MKIGGKHYRSVWPIGEDAVPKRDDGVATACLHDGYLFDFVAKPAP